MTISKTKLKRRRVERLKWCLGFTNGFGVHGVRSSGGLYLLWKKDIRVEVWNYSKGHIDSVVIGESGELWRFTDFYGEADESQMAFFWDLLRKLKDVSPGPWLCVDDFNEVLFDFEHVSRSNQRASDMARFGEALENSGLCDLGF